MNPCCLSAADSLHAEVSHGGFALIAFHCSAGFAQVLPAASELIFGPLNESGMVSALPYITLLGQISELMISDKAG